MEIENCTPEEVLETAKDYIVKLLGGIDKALELIDKEDFNEAINIVIKIFEGIQWLIQALGLTASLQKEPIDILEITGVFADIQDALKDSNYPEIKKVLGDKLAPVLDKWENQI